MNEWNANSRTNRIYGCWGLGTQDDIVSPFSSDIRVGRRIGLHDASVTCNRDINQNCHYLGSLPSVFSVSPLHSPASVSTWTPAQSSVIFLEMSLIFLIFSPSTKNKRINRHMKQSIDWSVNKHLLSVCYIFSSSRHVVYASDWAGSFEVEQTFVDILALPLTSWLKRDSHLTPVSSSVKWGW